MSENTPETANILLERIDLRLNQMNRTRYWLDKELSGGKTKVVTEIERKGSIPSEPRLRKMA